MILRDPVHGLVAFEGRAETVVSRLLGAREVQRQRRICQLGLTSLVFPGAEHSRFVHAIGTAHVMVKLLDRVRARQSELPPGARPDEQTELDAIAAALLHDIGHGPFSHLFEEVLPGAQSHEKWSRAIILDPDSDVNRTLREISEGMPARVASLLAGDHPTGFLSRAVAGPLDVDRCDFLLRDSHMTGVSYGVFDLDFLLRALTFGRVPVADGGSQWVLAIDGRKGLPPIEHFFLSRLFMYEQVYHHKATRAAEALIRGVFARVAELVREGSPPQPIPRAIADAALARPVSAGDYLALDDVGLSSSFKQWESAPDPVLSDLCSRLSSRDLPKTLPLPSGVEFEPHRHQALALAREVARENGFRADLSVYLDVPFDVPYEEVEQDPLQGLWVAFREQGIRRLGEVSFLLGELRNKRIERPRLILPGAVRKKVQDALESPIAPV
jgi:HD superfamily phosphohydrolase